MEKQGEIKKKNNDKMARVYIMTSVGKEWK